MAVAPMIETNMQMAEHCKMTSDMGMVASKSDDCPMMEMQSCSTDCEMMTVVSLLHFVEEQHQVLFAVSQIKYTPLRMTPEYHFSKPLDRPPFL
ncbi:hypothetical protein CW745_00495 [Psychromonas sp. psych-6C06]|nr:hypothetical protein CW745_00495 [Psychromonas sp. psych-6C06]